MKRLFFLYCTICHIGLSGQGSSLNKKYSIDLYGVSTSAALVAVDQTVEDLSFVFSDNFFDSKTLHLSFTKEPLYSILGTLLEDSEITYKLKRGYIIFHKKASPRYILQGNVKDSVSYEAIPFALVDILNSKKYIQTDEDGYFRISIEEGQYDISVNSLGYDPKIRRVEIDSDKSLEIVLSYNNYLSEVIIREDSSERESYHYEHYGYNYLKNLALNTPGLGGTHDLMHAVRSLPGVQSGSGGIGGHYVRGSNNSENLILLDGTPIYYPYHALGISSIFNPRIVKNMEVYKSGFRPQFGGRAASIMDVHIRNGSRDAWHGEASLSLQSADVIVEGPIWNKKASLFLYGKMSTIGTSINNIIDQGVFTASGATSRNDYDDILIKYSHEISNRSKVDFTYYHGGDNINGISQYDVEDQSFITEANLDWSNTAFSLNLRSILSPSVLLNAKVYGTAFENSYGQLDQYDFAEDFEYYSLTSVNSDLSARASLSIHSRTLQDFKFGIGSTRHDINPSTSFLDQENFEVTVEDDLSIGFFDNTLIGNDFRAFRHFFFLEHTASFGPLKFQWGLHHSTFREGANTFNNPEPRFNLEYRVDDRTILSLAASRMVQYLHLLSFSSVNLPRDIWYPSGEKYQPEKVWHYELGWHRSLGMGWHLDATAYFKEMDNFTIFDVTKYFEEDGFYTDSFTQGESESYGLEINLSKKIGRLKGNLSYSIANAERRVNNYNLDEPFPFQFDRRHELKLLGTYQFNRNWSIGVSAYYGTGHPEILAYDLNLENGIFQIDDSPSGLKNRERVGPQHRFDISVQYDIELSPSHHNIKLSIYNASDSTNPLLYYIGESVFDKTPGFSIPFLPSLHYTFSF